MSEAESLIASITIGTIMGTLMLDITRSALARISWLGSCNHHNLIFVTIFGFVDCVW